MIMLKKQMFIPKSSKAGDIRATLFQIFIGRDPDKKFSKDVHEYMCKNWKIL